MGFFAIEETVCAIEKDEMAVKAKIAKSLFLDFCFIKDRNGKSTGEFKENEYVRLKLYKLNTAVLSFSF